ncbi:GNAT family N-acetyltransferase [Glutamicibacter sp.]|uniref:GNAT family N-acetyltransferase n=1 Tax=Glutamicibacter sp. TaxID=1931995 RepID=UPI002B49D12D|nr:GNAT family N-acetyltransferase [Glutamicibacter sp.]HJX77772.1 GNAT family N-acetyltransferase [Glutamicibacter sp.]
MSSESDEESQSSADGVLMIRPWSGVEEVPELLDVWRSSVEGRRDFLSASDLNSVASTLETVYAQRSLVYVAQLGTRIVGFMSMGDERVELLWVHHEHRHAGVGRALVAFAYSKQNNVQMVVNAQNAAGIDFFRSCGFELSAEEKLSTGPAAKISLRHSGVGAKVMRR